MAHQEQDPRNFLIVAVGLGSIVTIVGTMFGLYSYYTNLRNEFQHERIAALPSKELKALREHEDKVLNGYAYLNAGKTQARIPVDQAMKLLAQRGRDAIPSIQPDAAPAASSAAPAAPAPEPEKKDDKKDEKKDEKKDDKKKDEKKDEKKDKKDHH